MDTIHCIMRIIQFPRWAEVLGASDLPEQERESFKVTLRWSRKRLRLTRFQIYWIMYYVYVLQSETDHGLYIGYTADLVSRLRVHNAGESKSTMSLSPLKLIYYEAYLMESDAMGRERFLKSGAGRRYIDKQLSEYFYQHPRQSVQ